MDRISEILGMINRFCISFGKEEKTMRIFQQVSNDSSITWLCLDYGEIFVVLSNQFIIFKAILHEYIEYSSNFITLSLKIQLTLVNCPITYLFWVDRSV